MMVVVAIAMYVASSFSALPSAFAGSTSGSGGSIDPYPPVHGGAHTGAKLIPSPDPLVDYRWELDKLSDPFAYQSFTDLPVVASAEPTSSFAGLETVVKKGSTIYVRGEGVITVKFAQEAACWVEFDSDGLGTSGAKVDMTLSENRLPGEVHNLQPKVYNTTDYATYRLEPNNQLYEGVRYVFINVTAAGNAQWTLQNLRRVCQVVPTNYDGSFDSSDDVLNRIWWTGAYTARVTMVGNGLHSTNAGYLGSELKDRGDRIAFLGDAHATQPTVLAAFGNYRLLWNSNEYTKNIGNGIQPYWVMWVLSVLDLYDATANATQLHGFVPWIEQRLDHAESILQAWDDPERQSKARGSNATGYDAQIQIPGPCCASPSLDWSRDDDRMGFGFESPNLPEAQRAFRALIIGASARYSKAIAKLGNTSASEKYKQLSTSVEATVRKPGSKWHESWGMHAICDAIIAGFLTPTELQAVLAPGGVLDDPLQLPSLSNFESFFLLKAFGKTNATEQAKYLLHRHWAGMLRLGATTFWERFDPQWEDAGLCQEDSPPVNAMNQDTSMSHPWSTGATSFLSNYGLGLQPTDAGWVGWQALPLLLDNSTTGLTWVRGTVPTPHGPISADFDLRTGVFEISAPQGADTGRLAIPKLGLGVAGVRALLLSGSGDVMWSYTNNTRHSVVADVSAQHIVIEEDNRWLYIVGLRAGSSCFQVEHYTVEPDTPDQSISAPPTLPGKWDPNNTNFSYEATLHDIDDFTGGAWVGKYGSAGFVLFNYSADSADVIKEDARIRRVDALASYPTNGGPPYPLFSTPPRPSCPFAMKTSLVASSQNIDAKTGEGAEARGGSGYVCACRWANVSSSVAVLQPPPFAAMERAAAGLSGNRWASFHIDIEAADEVTPYNITLYFLDYAGLDIRQGIKLMRGGSPSAANGAATVYRTIAPMVLIENFTTTGKYVTYTVAGSLRFRFVQVPSPKGNVKGIPPRPVVSAVFFD